MQARAAGQPRLGIAWKLNPVRGGNQSDFAFSTRLGARTSQLARLCPLMRREALRAIVDQRKGVDQRRGVDQRKGAAGPGKPWRCWHGCGMSVLSLDPLHLQASRQSPHIGSLQMLMGRLQLLTWPMTTLRLKDADLPAFDACAAWIRRGLHDRIPGDWRGFTCQFAPTQSHKRSFSCQACAKGMQSRQTEMLLKC